MDDLELDRALRETLSVTPSPEFVARVRTAVAESPRPLIVAGWLKPAVAVACAVALAIAVGLPRDEEIAPVTAGLKPSTTSVPPSTTSGPPSTTYVPPGTTYVAPRSTIAVVPTFRSALAKAGRSARPSARAMVAITSEPPLPEVIVAADDVEALVQFVSGARDLRFVASFDETPASVPWVMTDLSTAPIAGDALGPTPVHNN